MNVVPNFKDNRIVNKFEIYTVEAVRVIAQSYRFTA